MPTLFDKPTSEIGLRLRSEILAAGLSIEWVAKNAGLSSGTLSHYLHGYERKREKFYPRIPSPDVLEKIVNSIQLTSRYSSKYIDLEELKIIADNSVNRLFDPQISDIDNLRIIGMLRRAQTKLRGVHSLLRQMPPYNAKYRVEAKLDILEATLSLHNAIPAQELLIKIEKATNNLLSTDENDRYYLERGILLPSLAHYLRRDYHLARDGVLRVLNELSNQRIRSLAFRNLLVSTAHCVINSAADLDHYLVAKEMVESQLTTPGLQSISRARLNEGLARGEHLMSTWPIESIATWGAAQKYIISAKLWYENAKAANDPGALVNVQIIRTELAIMVSKMADSNDHIINLINRFVTAAGNGNGWDRYLLQLRFLVKQTDDVELIKRTETLIRNARGEV